jgi:MFS family permease
VAVQKEAGQQLAEVSRSKGKALWSVPFAAICLAHFLSYANGVMLEPVLPVYLAELGLGPALIGLIFAAFSVASFGTRPWVGHWVDGWSARGVYVLGACILSASSFGYLLPSLAGLVVARTVHGVGWAAINTAGPTIASSLIPAHRRGEALGYFSMMTSLAAITPALGFWLIERSGFPTVFALSGGLGLAAAATALLARNPLRAAARQAGEGIWSNLIERTVILPAVLNILLTCTQPILIIFVGLYASSRGIENVSVFFVARGLSQVAALFLSRLSDRWGRAPVLVAGFAVSLVGLLVMMSATSLLPLVFGGILSSAGTGLVMPTLMALAVDRAPINRRGAALATHTAAFQVGQGGSSLLWGQLIGWWGFQAMFLGGITAMAIALVLLVVKWEAAGARAYGRS